MNIFYTPPSHINGPVAEITGQEARHASRVLRISEGDELTFVDGKGGRYRGAVRRITKKAIQVEVTGKEQVQTGQPRIILGMGIIKKRDRLEFAVEKAVELGASQICLFRSDHTIKENVRMDRLESIALSAMKQSLRAWLPEVSFHRSFRELLDHHDEARCLVAHEKVSPDASNPRVGLQETGQLLLMVGPEGGFSPDEIDVAESRGASLYSLGSYRLRAETAVVAFLSQFLR